MKKFKYIYVLLSPSGKRYIGQTITTVEKRINRHFADVRTGCSLPIHNAMRKYGKKSITIEQVCALKCSQDYLNLIEDRAIIFYNTLVPNGYNLRMGGNTGSPHKLTRIKMSNAKKGRPSPNKGKIGLGKGRKHSKETKAKISAAASKREKGRPAWNKGIPGSTGKGHSGKKHSEEAKRKMSIAKKGKPSPMLGKSHTEETKAKLSSINKGKILSAETKVKISENNARFWKGKTHSKEARAKMSVAKKGRPAWNKGKKGGKRSKEVKAKISATMKRRWQERKQK